MLDDKPQNNRGEQNRKKAESFHLHISEDDLNGTSGSELYSDNQGESFDNETNNTAPAIQSYSSPQVKTAGQIEAEKQMIKQAKKAQKYRNKEKGKHNRRVFRWIWIFMIVLISIGLGQYLLTGVNDMLAVGRSKVTVSVEIPKNPTTQQVAKILYDDGIINKADFFAFYSKLTKSDGKYSNGTYKIDTDMDYEAIINNLQASDNRVDTVTVTLPEGMNMLEIGALLEKKGVCTSKELIAATQSAKLDNYDLIKSIKNTSARYYKVEGYLFPDTYDFYKSENPQDVLGKMINNCDQKLTKAIRDEATANNMSIDQVLTLASLIQAESADEADMYKVSSVLHNRLKNGAAHNIFYLQCDSTMYYPYRQKSLVPSNLGSGFQSKYSTYTVKGLPAGPICNPSITAIDAALNPKDTNYYYFCHDKDKKAYYAETAARHKLNLKEAGLS